SPPRTGAAFSLEIRHKGSLGKPSRQQSVLNQSPIFWRTRRMTHRKPRQGYRPKLALLALVIPLGAVGCAFHASGGAKSSSNASANSSSSAKSESKSSAKSGANMSGSASLKGDAKASGGGDASGGGKASGSGNAGGSGKASGSGNASAKSSSKASASASGSSSSSINFKSGTRVEGLGQSKKDYKFKSTVLVGGGSSSIKLGGSTSGSTKVKTGG